jgi:hypothetical protein
MKPAKLRLALVAIIFLVWIGYLAYLALPSTTSREILSRAQFLESNLDVIAQVDEVEGRASEKVVVQEVHWPDKEKSLVGQALTVTNLTRDCKGYSGAGLYILPLVKDKDGDTYRIAAVPRSPGYEGSLSRAGPIYAATAQNRRQLEDIPKPNP